MSEEHGENGNISGEVPEIELIIKVRLRLRVSNNYVAGGRGLSSSKTKI